MSVYRKKILEELPTKLQEKVGGVSHVNVLVLGPIGAGKSSFINSMMSGLGKTYYSFLNTMGSSNERVTRHLEKVFLSRGKKIRMCDTFGWGDEHFR